MDDGTLAVLDCQAAEVRFSDAEGGFLEAVGGPGDGPGEFGRPSRLLAPTPGSLWVVDQARGIQRSRRGDEGWMFANRMNQGLVGCAAPGTVVLGLTGMNRAEAYRIADGALL